MADLSWWEALVLGVVQGVTEWLPVSSSGHLALSRTLLGLEADTFTDLMLHVATLAVILVVMRRDIWALRHQPRTILHLTIASIPIGLAGFLFADAVEAAFTDLRVVAFAFLATGLVLGVTADGDRRDLDGQSAFAVGLAQMVALLPGASRSGWTIAAALRVGMPRDEAARFAFLLAIPALAGAVIWKSITVDPTGIQATPLVAAMVAALAAGAVSLRWMLAFVARRGVAPFAPYCLIMAAFTAMLWTAGFRL